MTPRPGTTADEAAFNAILAESPGAASWSTGYPSLVCDHNGRPAAFVLYRIVADEGELLNLAVAPSARRQGLARQLLEALHQLTGVWHLEVRQSNTAAIALYESCGYQCIGERPRYYSDGETALLYSRFA